MAIKTIVDPLHIVLLFVWTVWNHIVICRGYRPATERQGCFKLMIIWVWPKQPSSLEKKLSQKVLIYKYLSAEQYRGKNWSIWSSAGRTRSLMLVQLNIREKKNNPQLLSDTECRPDVYIHPPSPMLLWLLK